MDHGGKTTQLKFESSRNVKDLCGSVAIRNKSIQDLMIFDMFCGEKSVYNAFRPGPWTLWDGQQVSETHTGKNFEFI